MPLTRSPATTSIPSAAHVRKEHACHRSGLCPHRNERHGRMCRAGAHQLNAHVLCFHSRADEVDYLCCGHLEDALIFSLSYAWRSLSNALAHGIHPAWYVPHRLDPPCGPRLSEWLNDLVPVIGTFDRRHAFHDDVER